MILLGLPQNDFTFVRSLEKRDAASGPHLYLELPLICFGSSLATYVSYSLRCGFVHAMGGPGPPSRQPVLHHRLLCGTSRDAKAEPDEQLRFHSAGS